MKSKANCWPTQQQCLLLQAGLLPKTVAQQAWHAYCKQIDIQNIDYTSTTFLPLVFRNLVQDNNYPNEFQFCKSVYRHTWANNHTQLFELEKILLAFSKASIQICLLKGAAMINCYYHDLGVRVMGDIDLLIPEAQVLLAIKTLTDLAWQAELKPATIIDKKFLTMHHAIFFTKGNNRLDLHWVLSSEATSDNGHASFIYKTQSVRFQNTEFMVEVLCPEDQLLHILTHGLKYSAVPLTRWVADATLLLKNQNPFDWDYFFSQATQMRLTLMIKFALMYLHEHQFAHLPLATLRKIQAYLPHKFETEHLHFITHKQLRYGAAIKIVWYRHIRNSMPRNTLTAFLSFPQYLKNSWQLKSLWQLPFIAIHKYFLYLQREFLVP